MSVMFSKVTLTADNGNTATLLCSGSPKDHYDLEDWTKPQQQIRQSQGRYLPLWRRRGLYRQRIRGRRVYGQRRKVSSPSRRALAGQLGVHGLSAYNEISKFHGQPLNYLI